MGIVAALSIVGTVLTFMVGALGSFPLSDPGLGETGNESYGTEAVHSAAASLSGAYVSVIDELVSFQRDPDYERAEATRQQVVDFATGLIGDFQDLEERLRGELAGLTMGTDETAPAETP